MADFITVVFEPEIPFLKIQAKSIEKYVDPDLVSRIFVVVNDQDSVIDQIDKSWWGSMAHKVVVYPYSIFGYINRVSGWDNQQLCKLLAAARAVDEWSIVLDAKTFFVRKCKAELLFDANKACANPLNPQPVFESATQFVEKLYQVQLDHIIGPGGVPFFFHTQTVKSMIQDTEQISKMSFIEFFQSNVCYPNLITEFYLYSGYVKHKYGSFDQLYVNRQPWTCINISDWQLDQFDQLFLNMQKFLTLTVSVPSKTWVKLSPDKQLEYLGLLHTRNIIDDPKSVQKELNTVIN